MDWRDSDVKAPNHTYTMHSAGKQPGHEIAFGSICVPLWHEISALLSFMVPLFGEIPFFLLNGTYVELCFRIGKS